MTEAIFGLVGVVVGGLITGFVQGVQEWRRERADLRASARLLLRELQQAILGIRIVRPRMEAGGLPAIGVNLTVWPEKQGLLARALSDADWQQVAQAFDRIGLILENANLQTDEYERVLADARQRAPDDVDEIHRIAQDLRAIASRAADMPYEKMLNDVVEAEPALFRIAFPGETWDPSSSVATRELLMADAEGPAS